jgi:hypothetical protein
MIMGQSKLLANGWRRGPRYYFFDTVPLQGRVEKPSDIHGRHDHAILLRIVALPRV